MAKAGLDDLPNEAPHRQADACAVQAEAARQMAVLALLTQGGHADALAHAMADRAGSRRFDPIAARDGGLVLDEAGLRAYRGHARAQARRLLSAAYPTVAAMLGQDALGHLAEDLWRSEPPLSGDLGDWGGGLPALLASRNELRDWPWLSDSAQLDRACHLCMRAADARTDIDSLQRLGDAAPEDLELVLKPDVRVLRSRWPVALLRAAHQLPPEMQADAAARALAGDAWHKGDDDGADPAGDDADDGGDVVLVWRDANDGGPRVRTLPAAWGLWMRMLAGDAGSGDPAAPGMDTGGTGCPPSLSSLLTRITQAHDGFDFTAWLTEALREGWLWRVARR